MQKGILAVGLIVVGTIFLSCNLFPTSTDYYPLAIGNTWNWFYYTVMSSGIDAPPDTVETGNFVSQATRNEKLASGEDVVELVKTGTVTIHYPRETTYTITDTCYVRELSNLVLSYESKNDVEPETTLVLPLTAGKAWRITGSVMATAIGQEDVTVRAGTYRDAWKIRLSDVSGGDTFSMFYWYANRVGSVKYHMETMAGSYNFIYHGELVSAIIR